jgi:hypothetical protein
MTVRSIAVVFASAAAFASAPLMPADAHAAANPWRFVRQFPSVAACHHVGRALVYRHAARQYKCEYDYTPSGAPALDLYVR